MFSLKMTKNRSKLKRTLIIICLFCVIAYYVIDKCDPQLDFLWIFPRTVTKQASEIKCYDYNTLNMLEELTPDTEIPLNTSIFFVETSCHDNVLTLNPRQACAIESAAKMNPKANVYLLFPSPISDPKNLKPHVEKLNTYNNFKMLHINTKTFFEETPLEEWYKLGKIKSSFWPQSHMSDILRYTLLWKYGGIYLDLDVVVLRTFDKLTNFAGAESVTDVAAGVLSFSHNHELSNLAINDLRHHYKGYDWGWNGPGVITRVLRSYCYVCKVEEMFKSQGKCKDFTVFPPSVFYPIPWRQWAHYFTKDEDLRDSVMEKIKNSYVIHVWNKHSINTNVDIGSIQPYGVIAESQCPRVYSTLKDIF